MAGTGMITSVKYNLSLLSKRDKLKNRLGGYSPEKKTEYNLPKASTKQLYQIRKRLKEEQKLRMLKVILLTIILFTGLVCMLVYLSEEI